MKLIHRNAAGAAALALILAGCTSSEAQPIGPESVRQIVDQCGDAADALAGKVAAGDREPALIQARAVRSACQDAAKPLERAGVPNACRGISQAGVSLGALTEAAIENPQPENLGRVDPASQAFEVERAKCQASLS